MYRAGRTAWGLVAVGAATAVGVTTRNPGFIVITFLGTLALPRVLGLTPRGHWGHPGFGPAAFAARRQAWGGDCAGAGDKGPGAEASTPAPQPV
jgi:hypothetical protein